ncbi:MAG: glycosyltransferase [Cyanobacteria bacterium P01_C01_bin.38]
MNVGVVVIGRNEGNRLKQCLLSVSKVKTVVYVDSASSDGSVELARSLGVNVVELDLSIPFTAARARNAGFEYLVQIEPTVEFVQFVDGDCVVVDGWLEKALEVLSDRPLVTVVCGRRKEQFPASSVYNLLCDIEWDTPVGEAKACGGDSMMRVSALKQVGGFNPSLIAGEEPELCVRLRQTGGKIMRIDAEMTLHDAQIMYFNQWWKRSIRNGHAYAEGAFMHGQLPEKHWVKESRRIWVWAFILPLLAIASAWATKGISIILLVLAYGLLFSRVYKYAKTKEIPTSDALLYSLFCVLDKFPGVIGQIQFHLSRLLGKKRTIVEYKSQVVS